MKTAQIIATHLHLLIQAKIGFIDGYNRKTCLPGSLNVAPFVDVPTAICPIFRKQGTIQFIKEVLSRLVVRTYFINYGHGDGVMVVVTNNVGFMFRSLQMISISKQTPLTTSLSGKSTRPLKCRR